MKYTQAGNLQLKDITKTFDSRDRKGVVRAVDGVSLDIKQGEFLTLLGPSGCGKTTTLRLIAGFEMPNEGTILLDGMNITNHAPHRRDMAMVFQSYALFPHMTVFNNVAYGLQVQRMSKQVIRQKVDDVLEQVGLSGMDQRRPNELSGGQQQRVALARSLVMEPRVLLFDEPLSNLDAKLRIQMRSEIHGLQRRLGITSVYVTHDQLEAMALSDRIVVMNNGRIEQIGRPDEIYRRPKSKFVANFIGRANFIEIPVENATNDTVSIRILGQQITIPVNEAVRGHKRVLVVLRPEALSLKDDSFLYQVQIQQTMFLGEQVEYIVDVDGRTLIVVETDPHHQELFKEGQMVGIDFVSQAIHLLPLE